MLIQQEFHNSIVIQQGVKIKEKKIAGWTALHLAVLENNPEGSRMLLLHLGTNSANSIHKDGYTALIWALRRCKKEVLVELVKHESVSLDLREESSRLTLSCLRIFVTDGEQERTEDLHILVVGFRFETMKTDKDYLRQLGNMLGGVPFCKAPKICVVLLCPG